MQWRHYWISEIAFAFKENSADAFLFGCFSRIELISSLGFEANKKEEFRCRMLLMFVVLYNSLAIYSLKFYLNMILDHRLIISQYLHDSSYYFLFLFGPEPLELLFSRRFLRSRDLDLDLLVPSFDLCVPAF